MALKKCLIFSINSFASYHLNYTLFCMEATGMYCSALLNFFKDASADVWVENAIQIKRSSGITRGKQDKIDAQRIALYSFRNADAVRLWKPSSEILEQIRKPCFVKR
jgi:transposase